MDFMETAVVITGIGLVTGLGSTRAETLAGWRAGHAVTPQRLALLSEACGCEVLAAAAPAFDAAARLGSRRLLKYMSTGALLGCVAAHEALADAGLHGRYAPERIGLFAGVGMAAADIDEVLPMLSRSIGADGHLCCRRLGAEGLPATNPLLSFKILANMPPCLVSIQENLRGPNSIFTPWEGQTGAALLEAWQAVASGEADAVVTGAADNPAHPATVVFLKQRGLLQAGEWPAAGAAYLVLESEARARQDGRRIYARIRGLTLTPAAPSGDGPPNVADPLAARLGRTFAAAPAILLALAAATGQTAVSISGVDRQCLRVELEVLP